jgi:hypothetical protein
MDILVKESIFLPDGQVLAYCQRVIPKGMNFWVLISRDEHNRLDEESSWAVWPSIPSRPNEFALCFGREWGSSHEFAPLLKAAGYKVREVPPPNFTSNDVSAREYARQLLPGSY